MTDMNESHSMQWEHYVYTMTKHKLLERMEEFTKEDHPCDSDYHVIAKCSEALLNIKSI